MLSETFRSAPSAHSTGDRLGHRRPRKTPVPRRCQRQSSQVPAGGADKGYDRKEFVQELRDHQVTPHLACKPTGIIDDRTTRHPGYAISQHKRKRIEEIFGWLKTVAALRKTRHRGVARVGWMFTFALAAYNLIRMRNL